MALQAHSLGPSDGINSTLTYSTVKHDRRSSLGILGAGEAHPLKWWH